MLSPIVCETCHRALVERETNNPIFYKLEGDEPQEIGRGQQAALLRFLDKHRGERLPFDALYRALGGSPEVYRTLHSLRNKRRIPILCVRVAKASGEGKFGTYALGEGVKVWEPSECPQSGEA